MLARFFKPNWQHNKSEKRVKAISKLRLSDPQTQSILSQLSLEDKDELVRLAAIEKLDSLSLLIKISKNDSSDNIQQQALHRISQILLCSDDSNALEDKLIALKSLQNSNLLTHLVLNSSKEEVRKQAISQLSDNYSLSVIADKSQRAADRIQAAQRIACPEILEKLCKASRNKDKGVYKAARDKLQNIRDEEAKQEAIRHSINQLIENLLRLSTHDYSPLFTQKLSTLESEWDTLSSQAVISQKQAYSDAHANCSDKINIEKQRLQLIAQQEAHKQTQIAKSHQIYSSLCVLKENTNSPITEQQQLIEIETQLNAITEQWNEVCQYSGQQEQGNFNKIKSQISKTLTCYHLFLTSSDRIEQLHNECTKEESTAETLVKPLKSAKQFIKRLNWPAQLPKPASLEALENTVTAAQRKVDHKDSRLNQLQLDYSALLDSLNESIKQGEIRSADKQIKKAEQISKRLNGSIPSELEHRAKLLGAELQEMRDWQAYAVTPKKETLCQEMEALAETSLTVQELANQVRKVQKEWKLLDATDSVHSQQLWKRFKKASDAAYAPCDQHFSEQRQLRQTNLQRRKEICSKLESLEAPSSDTPEDWKHYEEQVRQAKHDWRSYSPVDRAPGKKLQTRLDAILSICEEPLKAFRSDNAMTKQRLIEESKQLLQASDFAAATETVKELQKEWKGIGPAPRNQERKLWNQFRENCSQIFETFYEGKQPNTTSNTIQPLLDSACQDLNQMLISTCSVRLLEEKTDLAQSLIAELESQNTRVSPSNSATVHSAVDYLSQLQDQLQQFQTEPYQTFYRKAELCQQLEHAIIDQCVADHQQNIRDAWALEKDTEHPLSASITSRFTTLLKIAESPDALESLIGEQEQRLRQICIRLEIASSQPSPAEDQALRMEYQMERLQQALAEQQQAFNLIEIKQLEHEWLCIPFAACFEEFNDRFESKLEHIF